MDEPGARSPHEQALRPWPTIRQQRNCPRELSKPPCMTRKIHDFIGHLEVGPTARVCALRRPHAHVSMWSEDRTKIPTSRPGGPPAHASRWRIGRGIPLANTPVCLALPFHAGRLWRPTTWLHQPGLPLGLDANCGPPAHVSRRSLRECLQALQSSGNERTGNLVGLHKHLAPTCPCALTNDTK